MISCEALEQFFRVGEPCTIVPFFQSRGYEVKLICFVRPQPERINSAYVQNIKTFVRDWEVKDFVKTLHKSLFYTRWFTIAREHGAKLIALPYDRAARKEGVVGRFLRLFSAEDLAPATNEYRANLTVGTAGVAAGRTSLQRLGRLGLTLDQRQRTRAAEVLREADEAAPTEPFYGLPPALVEQIEACYRDDNELFATSRWGVAWRNVFEPVAPPSYNELKSREERSRSPEYMRIIEEVWPKVRRIAKEPPRA